jgi:rubredoxin
MIGHKPSSAESENATSPSAAPDWNTIPDNIRCPMCEYDLRGLREPRCPECGYTFRWQEIIDRTRRRHDYLFEHHPENNIRAFIKTLVGGLVPWRFWTNLHPTQRPDLRRLWLYRSIIMALVWLPVAAAIISMLIKQPGAAQAYRSGIGIYRPSWTNGRLFPLWPIFSGKSNYLSVVIEPMLYSSVSGFIALMTLLLLALPAITAVPLTIFQATLRQAKVEQHHVQRCIIYSFDFVVWPAVAIAALAAVMFFLPSWLYRIATNVMDWSLILTFPLVWLVMIMRLAFACRCYLRLRHALAVVLACEVIALLLLAVLIMFVGQQLSRY